MRVRRRASRAALFGTRLAPPGGATRDHERQLEAARESLARWQDEIAQGRRPLTEALVQAMAEEQARLARLEDLEEVEDPQPEKMAGGPVAPG